MDQLLASFLARYRQVYSVAENAPLAYAPIQRKRAFGQEDEAENGAAAAAAGKRARLPTSADDGRFVLRTKAAFDAPFTSDPTLKGLGSYYGNTLARQYGRDIPYDKQTMPPSPMRSSMFTDFRGGRAHATTVSPQPLAWTTIQDMGGEEKRNPDLAGWVQRLGDLPQAPQLIFARGFRELVAHESSEILLYLPLVNQILLKDAHDHRKYVAAVKAAAASAGAQKAPAPFESKFPSVGSVMNAFRFAGPFVSSDNSQVRYVNVRDGLRPTNRASSNYIYGYNAMKNLVANNPDVFLGVTVLSQVAFEAELSGDSSKPDEDKPTAFQVVIVAHRPGESPASKLPSMALTRTIISYRPFAQVLTLNTLHDSFGNHLPTADEMFENVMRLQPHDFDDTRKKTGFSGDLRIAITYNCRAFYGLGVAPNPRGVLCGRDLHDRQMQTYSSEY